MRSVKISQKASYPVPISRNYRPDEKQAHCHPSDWNKIRKVISENLCLQQITVRASINKWGKHGIVVNLPKSGIRPSKVIPRSCERFIQEVMFNNPGQHLNRHQTCLNQGQGLNNSNNKISHQAEKNWVRMRNKFVTLNPNTPKKKLPSPRMVNIY